ncbi:MAG: TolC family protein [Bacteroidales bacterium]|nr:TolC family protein [Bacteroidales bacterium]
MSKKIYLLLIISILFSIPGNAQEVRKYTFEEIIYIARQNSPMAIMSRHRFRQSYWEFRTHKAEFLPTLTLNSQLPDLDRSIVSDFLDDGTEAFIPRNRIKNSFNVELEQNIGFTGGSIFVSSDLQRIDILGSDGVTSYLSNPISVGIRQPINGYNDLRWLKEIEPLKYETAKKEYINDIEQVTLRSVNYFFDLAVAQKNIEIAELNYANADTLYRIASGRYQLGTIAENDLLQMELAYLNTGTALNEANIDLEIKKFQMNSFLGLGQDENIELIIPAEIPELYIDLNRALEEAWKSNPDIMDRKRQLLEANRDVERTKSEKGLNAMLYANFGLTQQANLLNEVYLNPQDQEVVRLGIEIPILDWGLGRGKYKMAQSALELTRTTVQQAEMDFQQEVYLAVMQFNLQDDQLEIAFKADIIGEKRFEVTKQRFLIGRISVLDLNVAQTEKDQATRSYLSALRNYWNYFYNLRSLTLYNWVEDSRLEEDFDALIE